MGSKTANLDQTKMQKRCRWTTQRSDELNQDEKQDAGTQGTCAQRCIFWTMRRKECIFSLIYLVYLHLLSIFFLDTWSTCTVPCFHISCTFTFFLHLCGFPKKQGFLSTDIHSQVQPGIFTLCLLQFGFCALKLRALQRGLLLFLVERCMVPVEGKILVALLHRVDLNLETCYCSSPALSSTTGRIGVLRRFKFFGFFVSYGF